MKFKELDDAQRASLIQLYATVFSKKVEASNELFKSLLNLLIYGNAGCALADLTIIGIQLQRPAAIDGLVLPLVLFGIGILSCAFVFAGQLAITEQAADHWANTIKNFVQNQVAVEEIVGWGWNPKAKKVALFMLLASLLLLISGISLGLLAVGNLQRP